MMGEMHPDLMGTPRLELAFDQAVSPDFFQLRHLGFCVLTFAWIDQALAPIVAITSDFILEDHRFASSYLESRPSTRVGFFIFQNSVENRQDKGFLANKIAPLVSLI